MFNMLLEVWQPTVAASVEIVGTGTLAQRLVSRIALESLTVTNKTNWAEIVSAVQIISGLLRFKIAFPTVALFLVQLMWAVA